MEADTHTLTETHKPSTVTLAAHACQGLIMRQAVKHFTVSSDFLLVDVDLYG